jgi:phage terminase large subunit-like protein
VDSGNDQQGQTHLLEPGDLGLSEEVLWYMDDRGFELPTCVPAIMTPEPVEVPGAVFDPRRVDRVLDVFGRMRHTQGRWAGWPLNPDSWQIAYILAPVFGWVRLNEFNEWARITRELLVDVPRKNGKSTLSGGVAVYLTCADGEQGAQVLTAATTEDQAGFVFNPVKKIARSSPDLNPYVQVMARRINHKPSDSYLQVVASAADAQHGGNVHGAIIDELHLHKNRSLYEAISTGTGSRTQPLVVMITTADEGLQNTIYAEKRDYLEKVAKRIIPDPSFRGLVFAADKSDDPYSIETQKKANPGYGISPTAEYLADKAAKAQNSAAEKSSYLRLHLGLRTKQKTAYVDLDVWDRNASIVLEDNLKGRTCYGGLDLASTSDLCALCLLFPDGKGGLDAIWRHWIPQRAFDLLNAKLNHVPEEWASDGQLTITPGDVADYDFIREQIRTDRSIFRVRTIGYDPWNSSQLVNDLVADGAQMIKVPQTYAKLSPGLKGIKHMLLQGTYQNPIFRHGGRPIMRWEIDNLAVAMDPNENVKPDKAKAGDKIDGVAACVIGMSEVIAAGAHLPPVEPMMPTIIDDDPDTRSAYFTQGF